MAKMSKNTVWASYAVLILILGVIGYFVGKKQDKAELFASLGVVIGAVISIVLWVMVGKKMSY